MKIIFFLSLLLIQSCAYKTEKGFKQWMDLQVGKSIDDVYKKGFTESSVFNDTKSGNKYITFEDNKGIRIPMYGKKMSIARAYSIFCNIIWIVNKDGIRVGYDYNGNACGELGLEYAKPENRPAFYSVATAPAFDYAIENIN